MDGSKNTSTSTDIPAITIAGTENPMIDQAAGMMVQDMQSFLQGSEQIMMVAIAKAAKMATSPDTAQNGPGIAALAAFQTFMPLLPQFATDIGESANDIISGKFPTTTAAFASETDVADGQEGDQDLDASVTSPENEEDTDSHTEKTNRKKPPFLSMLIPGIILIGTTLLVLIF